MNESTASPAASPPPVATPRNYLPFTARALWTNLPQVLLGGLGLSLLSAPAYFVIMSGLFLPGILLAACTTAPGWVALLAQATALLREQPAGPGVLLRNLGRYYGRGTLVGLLLAVPMLLILSTLPLLGSVDQPSWVIPSLMANGTILAILLAISFYAIPLLVGYEQSLRKASRNSAILASRYAGNTVGLLSLGILFALATAYLSSGLMFFFPAVWGFFIASNALMVVHEALAQDDQVARTNST